MRGWIEDGPERVFNVGGSERATDVEMDAGTQMENVGEWLGWGPGFGEIAAKIHLLIALDQAAEEPGIDFLRLRIGGATGMEIGGMGFDEEDLRGGMVFRVLVAAA